MDDKFIAAVEQQHVGFEQASACVEPVRERRSVDLHVAYAASASRTASERERTFACGMAGAPEESQSGTTSRVAALAVRRVAQCCGATASRSSTHWNEEQPVTGWPGDGAWTSSSESRPELTEISTLR